MRSSLVSKFVIRNVGLIKPRFDRHLELDLDDILSNCDAFSDSSSDKKSIGLHENTSSLLIKNNWPPTDSLENELKNWDIG